MFIYFLFYFFLQLSYYVSVILSQLSVLLNNVSVTAIYVFWTQITTWNCSSGPRPMTFLDALENIFYSSRKIFNDFFSHSQNVFTIHLQKFLTTFFIVNYQNISLFLICCQISQKIAPS